MLNFYRLIIYCHIPYVGCSKYVLNSYDPKFLTRKSTRRFIEVPSNGSKVVFSTKKKKNSHFDRIIHFPNKKKQIFFFKFLTFMMHEINARRASTKCRSSLEQTYQNTRVSTLERYCDITFDV